MKNKSSDFLLSEIITWGVGPEGFAKWYFGAGTSPYRRSEAYAQNASVAFGQLLSQRQLSKEVKEKMIEGFNNFLRTL